ncbi:MAG: glycerol-3-phosphate 1-O-acyltransferase PlsY [Pseudomonadota bacterium]
MPDPISWEFAWPYLIGALVGGYLLGSIPFGLVLTRLAGYGDVRKIGSGNIGATNVLRTGNKLLALATLLLDGGKGAVAVLIAQSYGSDPALMAAAGSMLGHVFPVWLGFRGGKGVATALGILLALSPVVGVLCCLTWLIVALIFRYSSLAALMALALSPVYAWLLSMRDIYQPLRDMGLSHALLADPQRAQLCLFLAIIVWIRHHQNIRRLLTGQEPKIGQKKKAA